MKTYKLRKFAKFAKKERISDAMLCQAVRRALEKPDAVLGGEVIKQRIARPNAGKSGGYRTIVLFRKGARAVFVHGYGKNEKANISADEEKDFKKLALLYLNATEAQIENLLAFGELTRVVEDEEGT